MTILFDLLKSEYKNIKLDLDLFELKNKTFLITGSNGLIGSNIINYLNYLNNTYSLNIKIIAHSLNEPVDWLPRNSNITYLHSDLADGVEIKEKFDYLIYGTAYGQPKKSLENSLNTVRVNTDSLISLLNLALKNKSSVLFLSSSEIYGNVPAMAGKIDESYLGNINPIHPRAIYAESKRIAETICSIYKGQGLDIKIARIAITYGPGYKKSDTRFICEFINKSLTENSVKMLDKGESVRTLCFISDMIEMLLNVLLLGKSFVYNLAGIEKYSIIEIAKLIATINNVPLVIPEENKLIEGMPNNVSIDITKYQTEFNKNKFISVEKGINKTIDWALKMINQKR